MLALPELLLVDEQPQLDTLSPFLASHYHVVGTSHARAAVDFIKRASPTFVVSELTVDGAPAVDICRAAKSTRTAAVVLVTTSDPTLVPDALGAGCDSVLLKPFLPALLTNRLGRLRTTSEILRLKSAHLSERIMALRTGTNRQWPSTSCPYCNHQGVTSFDYAAMRREWYACLSCRKVWIGKRQD